MKGLESLRSGAYLVLNPGTDWLVRNRVHPNLLTTLGFLVTLSSAWAFHEHHVRIAGLAVLIGGLFDILDGRVARLSGLGSKFGAFYDSTLDRISEIAVFFGILSLYNSGLPQQLGGMPTVAGVDLDKVQPTDVSMIYMTMLAMAGSLMISYTRARAEAMGLDCRVGLMPRAERVVLIGVASLFFGEHWHGYVLKIVIFILAVLTNITAFQRIVWVWKHARGVPLDEVAAAARVTNEDSHGSQ
ncbi:MAG TPA: CDP-alcohol phosphatidyltransferase family protein [Longimicrobiales bacterium]